MSLARMRLGRRDRTGISQKTCRFACIQDRPGNWVELLTNFRQTEHNAYVFMRIATRWLPTGPVS